VGKINLDISKKSCILANQINLNKMNYGNLKTGFNKPTLITAQQYGTKVSVELDHSDTDIDELFDAFQTIIVGLGYHESTWKQWIVDRADEYKEEEIENAVDMGIYEPSPELRRAAEEYVNLLREQEIDTALAQHNAHEDGFELREDTHSVDGGFDGKPHKGDTGTTYFTVPVNFYIDDDGNKVYDFEGMADQFENQLSELDDSVVVMCSVETKDKPKKKNKKNK
jgi:hypothetical protein